MSSILGYSERQFRNLLLPKTVTSICDFYNISGRQRENLIGDPNGNTFINHFRGKMDSLPNLSDFRDELQIGYALGFSELKELASFITNFLAGKERNELTEDQLLNLVSWIDKKTTFSKLTNFQREALLHKLAKEARKEQTSKVEKEEIERLSPIIFNEGKQEEETSKPQRKDSSVKVDLFKEFNDLINSKLPLQSNLNNENKSFEFPRHLRSGKECRSDSCIIHVQEDRIIFTFPKGGYIWHLSQFPTQNQQAFQNILSQFEISELEIDKYPFVNENGNNKLLSDIISLYQSAKTIFLCGWEDIDFSKLSIPIELESLELFRCNFADQLFNLSNCKTSWFQTLKQLTIYCPDFTDIDNTERREYSWLVKVKNLDLSSLSTLHKLTIDRIDLSQTRVILPNSLKELNMSVVDDGEDHSDQINNWKNFLNLTMLPSEKITSHKIWKKKRLMNLINVMPDWISNFFWIPIQFLNFFRYLRYLLVLFLPFIKCSYIELNDFGLNSFPKKIFALKNLRFLILQNNRFTSFPIELMLLTSLTWLDLSHNGMNMTLNDISKLTKILHLNLASNQITLNEMFKIANLVELNLSDNSLTSIPAEICKLSNLRSLNLSFNHLDSLPDSIGSLSMLHVANLRSNKFTFLPPSFYSLTKLEILDLSDNRLTEFGNENWNPPLTKLNLSNNLIKELPRNLRFMPCLILISFSSWHLGAIGNSLKYPPNELTNMVSAMPKFMEEAPIEIVSKKLIFWGEERAGKTTLMNSLVEGRLLSEKEHEKISKTIGFQVSKLPAQNLNFNVNMWDFAGEIWAVPFHQFFLTKDALYLIVFDLSKPWSQLLKEVSDRINVIVSRSLDTIEVLLVGTHAGSKSIEYPANLMRQLYDNVRNHFNEDQVSFLKVNGEVGVCLELVDLQNPFSSNFIEFRKWLYEYLLDGKFKTSPIYHQFLQKIEDPSFRQIISLKNFLESSGLNQFSRQIRDLYLNLFHKQGHIAYFPKADSILLDSRWLSLDFSKLRKSRLEDPEFPKTFALTQSTIEKCLGTTSIKEAIQFFKLFNLCFEPKLTKKHLEFVFPSLWPESPNLKEMSFLSTANWCVYSIRIKFPNRSPPLGLFHRVIVSFLDKLDSKNLIAWEFGIVQKDSNGSAIGFHETKEQGWLIRMYLQEARFQRFMNNPNFEISALNSVETIQRCALEALKSCNLSFDLSYSCTCNGCRQLKDGDRNWDQIVHSQTLSSELNSDQSSVSSWLFKKHWLGAEIVCLNHGPMAQWQKLCPNVLKSPIPIHLDHKHSLLILWSSIITKSIFFIFLSLGLFLTWKYK